VKEGTRVQLHPATIAWLRGDRYGTVTRVMAGRRSTWYEVRLDKSNRKQVFRGDNLIEID
jgi:hypothetical protein